LLHEKEQLVKISKKVKREEKKSFIEITRALIALHSTKMKDKVSESKSPEKPLTCESNWDYYRHDDIALKNLHDKKVLSRTCTIS
jgi:hypothetical protein